MFYSCKRMFFKFKNENRKSDQVQSPPLPKRSSVGDPFSRQNYENEDLNHTSSENQNENMIELPLWMMRGEVYIFDYGVIVLWNFTKQEELRLLDIFKPFSIGKVESEDMIFEDMNYQYDLYSTNRPRMFNDMIT